MGGIGLPILIVLCSIAISVLFIVWPTCRICRRAGFSPWLGLVAIVPIANGLLLWFLALSDWPALKPTQGGT